MPPLGAKRVGSFLILGLWIAWNLTLSPAAAQGPGAGPLLEKPQPSAETPGPAEEKKEAPPPTCGPLICDTCVPIEENHLSLQWLGALNIYSASFSPNWRAVSTKGNFYTFNMPVKLTYGPTQNLETYITIPFIVDWAGNLDRGNPLVGLTHNGERSASYAGIGDITTVAKYLVLAEDDLRPAVSLVGGVEWPSGHAHHLNPRFLSTDDVGTGSFSFISGFNLFKWVKPFLLYSNIWLNSPVNMFKLRSSDVPQAVRNRENVTFNLAAEYPLNKQWVLLLEMYSTWDWTNRGTESLGFQSPTTLLGFLPGIEFLPTEKLTFSAGCSFDVLGKFGSKYIVPMAMVYYNF